MLLNLTRMSVNDLGGEWRNELQIGSWLDMVSELYQPLEPSGYLFVAPNVEYLSRVEDVYDGKSRVAEYEIDTFRGQLDLGVQLRDYAELRVGPFWGTGRASVETGSSDLEESDEDFAGWATSLIVDRQDRTLFAREGYYLGIDGEFAMESMGGESEYEKISGQARGQFSRGDHTYGLGLQGGTSLGSELPSYAELTLGGAFSFAGLAEDQFRGSYLGVGSLSYRYRLMQLPSQLGRAVYAMARFDAGNVWEDSFDTDDLRYGALGGIGADSVLGPLYLGYGRTDDGYDSIYFSLGTVF
jgi:NTE family protein